MRDPGRHALLLSLVVAIVGCDVPRFTGPQIQQPPPDFTLQPETSPTRPTFPEREVVFHTAWVHTALGGVSVIYVDGHPGILGVEEVMTAREEAMAAEPDADAVFGEVEALRVDGRDAWGWYERIESSRRGLVEVTYRAVIPYDSVTYVVEFVSGEPSIKRAAPDTLREVVSTFGVGRTTYDIPVILVVLGGIIFVVATLRARSRERADRLRSVNLVSIQRNEEAPSDAPPGGEGSGPDGTPERGEPASEEDSAPSADATSSDAAHPRGPAPRPKAPEVPPPDTAPPDPSAGPPDS